MKPFGLRVGREITGRGQFHCPKCMAVRFYQQKHAVKQTFWHFLPFFNDVQVIDEYVECQVCGQTYRMDILEYNPASPTDRLMLSIKYALESGISVNALLDELVCAGMNAVGAAKLVNSANKLQQKVCPNCGIEQVGSLLRCKQCSLFN
jgi:predicted RNA-binding Zn-ribbon protein involved in translation (DUF1610 family)